MGSQLNVVQRKLREENLQQREKLNGLMQNLAYRRHNNENISYLPYSNDDP